MVEVTEGLSPLQQKQLDTVDYVHKVTADLIKPPVVGGGLAVAAHVGGFFRDCSNVDYITHDRHVNRMKEIFRELKLYMRKDGIGNYHAKKGDLKVDMWVLYPYLVKDEKDEHVIFETRHHNPGAPVPYKHFYGTPVSLYGTSLNALNVDALVASKVSSRGSKRDKKKARLERERDMEDVRMLVEAEKVNSETLQNMLMYAKF